MNLQTFTQLPRLNNYNIPFQHPETQLALREIHSLLSKQAVDLDLQPVAKIHGVNFFDKPSSCISYFENTHWTIKAISNIQSFGNFFSYALNKLNFALYPIDKEMEPFTNPEELSKRRLAVCIHGLNSGPKQFKWIKDELQKKDLSETDVYIPHVLLKGNAKLDDMVKPILKEIATWAETSGEKELVLVGISNGGRISRAITAEIAKSENLTNIKKIKFVSIVGACKGSTLVNLANYLGLSWLMSKNISEEMPTDSKRNQQLDLDWMEGLNRGPKREYTFIASPHDWQVINYDSSLMETDKDAHYGIITGHGHNSIVTAAAKIVAQIITN